MSFAWDLESSELGFPAPALSAQENCVGQAELLEWKYLKYRNLMSRVETSSNISGLEREAKWVGPFYQYPFFCLGEGVGAHRKGGDVWPGTLSILLWYMCFRAIKKVHPHPSVCLPEPLPRGGLCYEHGHHSEVYFRDLSICFCCLWDFLFLLHLFGAEEYAHLKLIEDLIGICMLPEIAFSCRVSPPAEENLKTPSWQVFT